MRGAATRPLLRTVQDTVKVSLSKAEAGAVSAVTARSGALSVMAKVWRLLASSVSPCWFNASVTKSR